MLWQKTVCFIIVSYENKHYFLHIFIRNFIAETSQFTPIEKLGLPLKQTRQFRRVNDAFVESLTQELLKEPCGSYGCLFMVAKKEPFDLAKKDAYEYEVLGGTHLMLVTKRLHTQYPENHSFSGRMARISCGLADDQAIYLGAMCSCHVPCSHWLRSFPCFALRNLYCASFIENIEKHHAIFPRWWP